MINNIQKREIDPQSLKGTMKLETLAGDKNSQVIKHALKPSSPKGPSFP